MGRVQDKVALVTGSAHGLGASHAVRLAAEGALVFLADIDFEGAKAAAAAIRDDGGHADGLHLDVTQEDSWIAALHAVRQSVGRLDILINNAGVGTYGAIQDLALEDWERCFAINARGSFLGCKQAFPLLRDAGGGSIVNISSSWGLVGRGRFGAYSASKAAVRMLTKSAAADFAPFRIRVNSVHPGVHPTDLNRAYLDDPEQRSFLLGNTLFDHPGDPALLSAAVLFLASDEAGYITGAELAVDGGYTAI